MTLTIVMAVYGQPEMLAHQLAMIESYDDHVLDQLHVRIVDDHGDPPVTKGAIEELRRFCDARLYRVLDNIPWNQMGARNVGMREAPEGPCVMLDPDMVIEREMAGHFMARANRLIKGHVVKFALRHVRDGMLDYSSPNTWLIHKTDFFRAGGYDEEFRGHKGWSDCLLQETLKAFYPIEQSKELNVSFYLPSNGPEDAQVPMSAGVDRDISHNKQLKRRKNKLIDQIGGFKRYIARGLKPANFQCKVERII